MQVLKATSQPEALLNRAASLINSGHTGAARALVAAARRLDPQLPRSAELAARIAMHEGHLDEARGELDAAITTSSANGTLRKLRSEVRRMLDDVPGAAADNLVSVSMRFPLRSVSYVLKVAACGPEDGPVGTGVCANAIATNGMRIQTLTVSA